MAKGSHLAPNRRRRRRKTSRGGMVSGAPGAYWGANLKRVEQSSHFPLDEKMKDDVSLSVSNTWREMANMVMYRNERLTVTSGNIQP